MSPDTTAAVEEADRRFRTWMRQNLDRASRHFGLTVVAEPIFGWLLRSISAPAEGTDGRVWLRVVSERSEWTHGHAWTGNADANVLRDLPKPRVVEVHEWAEGEWRRQRAEVLTLLPGAPCSPTADARPDIVLPPQWWEDLQRAVARLAVTPTNRVSCDQDRIDRRVREIFGNIGEIRIEHWETVHGDMHWANLHTSPFGLLDWEQWGRGPAGTDAATLYCYSLAVPHLAQRVRACFPVLDTPDGHRAQLYVTARLLHRASFGDHPYLVETLRHHGEVLLEALNLRSR